MVSGEHRLQRDWSQSGLRAELSGKGGAGITLGSQDLTPKKKSLTSRCVSELRHQSKNLAIGNYYVFQNIVGHPGPL